ncbi:hypothetical protein BHE74_00007423 [Ensete ventricosum]|nr:hypothetical protein BHE74_00007423 [Ensete ventricosum]
MLGPSQVQASGRGQDDVVRNLSRVCRELVERIRGLPGVHQKLVEGIRSWPRVSEAYRDFARSFPKKIGSLPRWHQGVCQKKAKRLTRRSSGIAEKLVRMDVGQVEIEPL